MAEAFLRLSAQDRRDALGVAADRSGRPAHLLERTSGWFGRSPLYGSALGEHLVFKGGTSLSKAYKVIRRFSEDVDLTYNIRAIAPDLVGASCEALPEDAERGKALVERGSSAIAGMGGQRRSTRHRRRAHGRGAGGDASRRGRQAVHRL